MAPKDTHPSDLTDYSFQYASGIEAQRFTPNVSGTISSLNFYLQFFGADTLAAALYADNGTGVPGALLASGQVSVPGAQTGWISVPLTHTLTGGTTYWLSLSAATPGSSVYYWVPGGLHAFSAAPPTWPSFPDPWVPGGSDSRTMAAFASYLTAP